VPSGSTACACADSGGIGTGGIETLNDATITGNTVTSTAPDGTANAVGGGGSTGNPIPDTINGSLISGNSVTATTTSGSANAQGAGVWNTGALLTVRGTTVKNNTGTASGPSGTSQGGGIWNGNSPFNSPGSLTILDSALIHNTLTGSNGITPQGGGLFTAFPVTLTNTTITNNIPDQCVGC
jgi:hypothetical protein